jgi:CRP/FNR family transcriptional regulator, cyclic AMP receptor protein
MGNYLWTNGITQQSHRRPSVPLPETNILAKVALFEGLNPKQWDRLNEYLYGRIFTAGSNIITAEQPGEVVYVILRGAVKIYQDQADGRRVILALLGPGDIVGEMSLIDSAGRSANVISIEDSHLLWMERRAFQHCLETIPEMNANLVKILSRRVRLANEQIQALASLDVYGRVARQFLAFAEKYGETSDCGDILIPIRLTQSDLAELVGASRKRVNQVMVSFKRQRLIKVDGDGYITVQNRKELARLC